jgi:hypothetical protein
VALRTARRQLDRWRSQHRPHTRLPEELWRKATALARRHGLNKTASALGLKYDSLKKRVETRGVDPSRAEETSCEFVEFLAGPMDARSCECTIELDDGSGTTVRIHVKGVRMADLASFASALRSTRA